MSQDTTTHAVTLETKNGAPGSSVVSPGDSLGHRNFDDALATTIGPPNPGTSRRVVRAASFRHDGDGDVLVQPAGMGFDVAVDDPLALLAVTMAAIKFGHPPEMLEAAQTLVAAFRKEPTR